MRWHRTGFRLFWLFSRNGWVTATRIDLLQVWAPGVQTHLHLRRARGASGTRYPVTTEFLPSLSWAGCIMNIDLRSVARENRAPGSSCAIFCGRQPPRDSDKRPYVDFAVCASAGAGLYTGARSWDAPCGHTLMAASAAARYRRVQTRCCCCLRRVLRARSDRLTTGMANYTSRSQSHPVNWPTGSRGSMREGLPWKRCARGIWEAGAFTFGVRTGVWLNSPRPDRGPCGENQRRRSREM